ncbi:MAG: energy transducer TonB [Verrucomicrobia bacterium]|nr:energy transducer TonB [Verrucomicrobiota bacterium]
MKPHVAALALLCLSALGLRLSAQEILLAQYKGRAVPVVQAHKNTALVRDGDELVPVMSPSFAFREGGEFLPTLVTVSKLDASTRGVEFLEGGGELNNEFLLRATFTTPYEIPAVYLVLQLHLDGGMLSLFVQEIGDLHAGQPRRLDLSVPLSHPLGEGHYVMHLYSGGRELLHTAQPADFRERALDHLVAQRAAGQPDGPPKLLVGPAPEYPRSLRKTHPTGKAVVHCQIHKNGAVTDLAVTSATDPAFGEAALAAVRQWRFVPRIKGGEPVDTATEIPLNFTPDKKT